MLVMTTTNEKFDAVVRVITSMWMPWQNEAVRQRCRQGR